MKAIKKPIEIDVEQFKSYGTEPNEELMAANALIKEEAEVYKVFNHLHNSWIEVKLGDYLNISNPEDIYPIDANYFAENYNLVN